MARQFPIDGLAFDDFRHGMKKGTRQLAVVTINKFKFCGGETCGGHGGDAMSAAIYIIIMLLPCRTVYIVHDLAKTFCATVPTDMVDTVCSQAVTFAVAAWHFFGRGRARSEKILKDGKTIPIKKINK